MRKVSGLCELITRSNRACGLSVAAQRSVAAQATLGRATHKAKVSRRAFKFDCAPFISIAAVNLYLHGCTHTHTYIQANIEGICLERGQLSKYYYKGHSSCNNKYFILIKMISKVICIYYKFKIKVLA